MDFRLTDEQRLIQRQARDVLLRHCPAESVRRWLDEGTARPAELWRRIAELGWLGFAVPAEHGGLGADFLDLALLHEECGRALVPTLFGCTTAAALAIVTCGTPAQQRRHLPPIARGETAATLAVLEAGAIHDPGRTAARLERRRDGGWALYGEKLCVDNGADADLLVVVARGPFPPSRAPEPAARETAADAALALALVERRARGITVEPLATFSGDPAARVVLDGVALGEDALLGGAADQRAALRDLDLRRTALLCAEMLGSFGRVLDLTTDYVKTREQFGRPIGSFQAVQHALADMAIALEGARCAVYQAAWRLARGLPAAREVAIAKAWISPAYTQATLTAHQLHGGMGFVTEYDLHLYSNRAKGCETKLGGAARHLDALATALLA
jgi:alkylation response protein AidB-like acyl-CoA dehydrogenase